MNKKKQKTFLFWDMGVTARSPSAIDLLAAYCSGKTSPVEAIEASLAAIKSDPTNSWVYVAEAESFS